MATGNLVINTQSLEKLLSQSESGMKKGRTRPRWLTSSLENHVTHWGSGSGLGLLLPNTATYSVIERIISDERREKMKKEEEATVLTTS